MLFEKVNVFKSPPTKKNDSCDLQEYSNEKNKPEDSVHAVQAQELGNGNAYVDMLGLTVKSNKMQNKVSPITQSTSVLMKSVTSQVSRKSRKKVKIAQQEKLLSNFELIISILKNWALNTKS
jgi:hypothetical protein